MTNRYGIEISAELGHQFNKALFEGDTELLFSLLSNYLKDNNLKIPRTALQKNEAKPSQDDDQPSFECFLR